jgi:hypothetical protein
MRRSAIASNKAAREVAITAAFCTATTYLASLGDSQAQVILREQWWPKMSNLAGARTKWGARSQRARAHAEAWAERWRDIAEEVAAAGAAAVVGDGAGGIGAEPVSTRVAQRINALHGEAGQILHADSLSGQPALWTHDTTVRQKLPWAAQTELLAWILPWQACGVKRIEHNRLWWGCKRGIE